MHWVITNSLLAHHYNVIEGPPPPSPIHCSNAFGWNDIRFGGYEILSMRVEPIPWRNFPPLMLNLYAYPNTGIANIFPFVDRSAVYVDGASSKLFLVKELIVILSIVWAWNFQNESNISFKYRNLIEQQSVTRWLW